MPRFHFFVLSDRVKEIEIEREREREREREYERKNTEKVRGSEKHIVNE